jgi:hypothetical protein
MGFWEDLESGIGTVSGVAEDIGQAAENVSGAVQAVQQIGSGASQTPASGALATSLQSTQVFQGMPINQALATYSSLMVKSKAGLVPKPLTSDEQKFVADFEAFTKNYKSGVASGMPLEYYSGGAPVATAGIQQVGLLSDITSALGMTAPEAQAYPGTTIQPQTVPAAGGLPVPWWKGPGGKLQLPWNDPRIPQFLQQFALDDAYLRIYYRAPKGYVIIRDANGKPYAVLRQIAKQFGLWRPAAKPPISATDWKNYKRNRAIEKRLVKIARPALRKSTRSTSTKRRK